jgi:YqjK-like protein
MNVKSQNFKSKSLAKRREFLVLQAATQRQMLAHYVEIWRAPLSMVDRGICVIRYIKQNPLLTTGVGFGIFTILKSNHPMKWVKNGWLAWTFLQKLFK